MALYMMQMMQVDAESFRLSFLAASLSLRSFRTDDESSACVAAPAQTWRLHLVPIEASMELPRDVT